ncbi:DNA polymerase I [Ramlibacter tataouinensis]|uniref:DNA polymerase I n=1 Tax=Ramlibacter tataouinensis (strain ATCC BAA-407 / DSM 14655 / LMG 21543 / TTB310) TaxID=365046 RepID=F5Y2K9_RAMTT|nr:DNA polymerase I [Ramlibacter tataouinensis]AEG92372.1 Candidate DNA polymerase I [Ramlibacter tataouinensis TTB310]
MSEPLSESPDEEQAPAAQAPEGAGPKVLLLVDGSSYLYRAFHAMPDLRAVPGDPGSPATGAIRGMINMMQKLRRDVRADYAACVFDAPGKTFRDDLYPGYKANRSAMPDDLRAQIEPIHEVVRLLGWKVLNVPGVEADDVIGTLSCMATERGIHTVISSGDKDLSQLVNDHVKVIDTMNDKVRDVAGVEAEFGVPPRLMVDYQVLVGDSVDNVPGVDKVGPKTAVKLLQEYGSLDALVERAAEVKGAVGENLRKALPWLPTGRELLTIRKSCDLRDHIPGLPELEDIVIGGQDTEKLKAFYERYGFKGLARQLEEHAVPPELIEEHRSKKKVGPGPGPGGLLQEPDLTGLSQVTNLQYDTLLDWEQFEAWLAKIEAADLVAVDTETSSLDEMRAEIIGLSFSTEPGVAAYVPLAHSYADAPPQLPREEVLARLKPWLEDPGRKKLGQHVKYDRHVFANHGIEVRGYAHDTMLQSYVLEVHKPHGLASLAERHLGRSGIDYETIAGKGAHQIPFSQVAIDKAAEYSCEDSDQTLDVHLALWPRLEQDGKLRFIYELEMQSSETLFRIERNGVLIDAATLARQSAELGQRILQLERECHELAGQPFNLGSPKQIGEIFFGKLGLPVVKKTPSGAPSTDEEVLEKLAEDFPLPAKVLEHRSLSKLKGTYTDKLAQMAHPRTGRVHTHYAQAVAVTGRLSSNEPNLQNIPVKTAEGRRVREAFVAPPGHLIASADYSQIELRIMAHLSEDPALLRAFTEGLDVHRATAAEVFGVPPDQVTSEQRRYAKVINFGLIYGMSSFGLARNLAIDNQAAKNYIERYFQRYPGVKNYMDETRLAAKSKGYVETVFGRRLYLPEINSPNGPRRGGAERAAINAPMQGTAADLIKLSMVKVQEVLDAQRRRTKMIMQVHDELVFEVPEDEVEWVRGEIPRLMAGVAELRVPLLAEIGLGENWEKAH